LADPNPTDGWVRRALVNIRAGDAVAFKSWQTIAYKRPLNIDASRVDRAIITEITALIDVFTHKTIAHPTRETLTRKTVIGFGAARVFGARHRVALIGITTQPIARKPWEAGAGNRSRISDVTGSVGSTLVA